MTTLHRCGFAEAWVEPIPQIDVELADDGTIISGHHRLRCLARAGVSHVKVHGRVYDISEMKADSRDGIPTDSGN